MKRSFRVGKELKPYIAAVLKQRDIPFKFIKEGDELKVEVPLSGERFHKVVQKARATKLTRENGIPVLTKEEADDPLVVGAICGESGAFVTLGQKYEE